MIGNTSSLRTSLLSVNSVNSTPRTSTASSIGDPVTQNTSIFQFPDRVRSYAMRNYWFAVSISLFFVIGKLLSAAGLLLFTLTNTFYALGWIKDDTMPSNLSFFGTIIELSVAINLMTNILNRTSSTFAAFLPFEFYTIDNIKNFNGQIRTGQHLLSTKKFLIAEDESNDVCLYEIINQSAWKISVDKNSNEQTILDNLYSNTETLENITDTVDYDAYALLCPLMDKKNKASTSLESLTAQICFGALRAGLTGSLFYSTNIAFLSGLTLIDNSAKMLGISVQSIPKWATVGWITSAALVASLTFNLPNNVENALKFCQSIDRKMMTGNANLPKKAMALTIVSCTYAILSTLCWAYFQGEHALSAVPILDEYKLICEILNIIGIYTALCVNLVGFAPAAEKMYKLRYSSMSDVKIVSQPNVTKAIIFCPPIKVGYVWDQPNNTLYFIDTRRSDPTFFEFNSPNINNLYPSKKPRLLTKQQVLGINETNKKMSKTDKWEMFARILVTFDALGNSAGSFTGSREEYLFFLGDHLKAAPGQSLLSLDIAIITTLFMGLYREHCCFITRNDLVTHDNKKEAKLPAMQTYVLVSNTLQYVNMGENNPRIENYDLTNEQKQQIQHYPETLRQQEQADLEKLIKTIKSNPTEQHYYRREYSCHQYAAIIAGAILLTPTLAILNNGTEQQRAYLVLAESLINYISTVVINTGFNQQGIDTGVATLKYLSSCASTCFSASRGSETNNETIDRNPEIV